jgi:hypothetical protein
MFDVQIVTDGAARIRAALSALSALHLRHRVNPAPSATPFLVFSATI